MMWSLLSPKLAKSGNRQMTILLFGAIIIVITASYFIITQEKPIPTYSYNIIHTYPHDPEAFTQGLVFEDGVLYEGTGIRNRSSIRKIELESGDILQMHNLSSEYFGEGITIYQDKILQLTWRSNLGFVYDKESFELIDTFEITTEGWGLTHDGSNLIMSDGSSSLFFLDFYSYEIIRTVEVGDKNDPVLYINELEYIGGEVYANIWQSERIARIDPKSGDVIGWLDLRGLADQFDDGVSVDVLNGIAFDDETDRLFVTGKLWPFLYEIEIKLVK